MVLDVFFVIIAIMENSNLISLLKTFSKKEIKEFDKFLRSPYFTEGKNIRHKIIYDYYLNLKVFYPGFTQKDYTKENMHSKLYPGSKYNDGIMRKLNSDLYKLAEKFIVQMELDADEFKRKEYLISSLGKRKLDKAFMKQTAECYKFLDENSLTLNNYFNRQLIDILVNDFSIYRQLPGLYNLQNESDNFFVHFLARSLDIYRSIAISKRIFNAEITAYFMEEVIKFINDNPEFMKKYPVIMIKYYGLMIISRSDESYYFRLKSLKNSFLNKLDEFGRINIYNNLESFCTKMIREGKNQYRKELLENDIEILENGIYDLSDYVNYTTFLQKVRNAARLNKFAWAQKFIDHYRNKLDPQHENFAVNYALAEISFEKKHFDKALEYVAKVTIDFSIGKQWVRNMMIKIFYETGSFENAYSVIDSSRHYITKYGKLPEGRKKSFMQFLKYISNLIDAGLKPDEVKLMLIKKKVNENEYFIEKEWVLEKIDELEKHIN